MKYTKIFYFFLGTLLALGLASYLIKPDMEQTFHRSTSQKRSLIDGQPNLRYSVNENTLEQHVEKQWALKDISILQAWEYTKGTKDIVVAVIDTGVHVQHSCLKPNLWINKNEIPNNNKDDDGNGFVDDIHGWNFVTNNNDIQDKHGHGTHIAGLIAATGRTKESPNCKVIGVAPKVSLMILKYYSDHDNNKNIENTIKSIEYAIDHGASIINYSGGGPGSNEREKALIAKAADKGIIFVSASGNDSSEIGKSTKYYPANYELPNILYVQSKNSSHEIIDSSNWVINDYRERKIYQTAPGERIISTLPPRRYLQGQLLKKVWRSLAGLESLSQDSYGYLTGTSQATAVATGVTALVKSLYPTWDMRQVINQVSRTGFDQGNEKIQAKTHEGKKLNAVKALNMRDQNIDINDFQISGGGIMPATGEASELKNLNQSRGRVDIYSHEQKPEASFKILSNINKSLKNKKKTQ